MKDEGVKAEVERVLSVLRISMRILEVSNRDVEKKLGLSYGYLSRLFSGSIELKVEHIIQILEVLGLTPAEFFQLAYPRKTVPPTESATRMRSILEGIAPPPEERPMPRDTRDMTSEDLEAVVSKMVRRVISEMKA